MSLLLHIETATATGSIAISEMGHLLALSMNTEKNAHASQITLLVMNTLQKAERKLEDIKGISVSMGPGSYTGHRIGVATAKGLCYALGIPLMGINTLEIMASGINDSTNNTLNKNDELNSKKLIYCPMIDARRMEVYLAMFTRNLEIKLSTRAEIINQNTFVEILKQNKIIFFGDGALKIKELYESEVNAIFNFNFINSAAYQVKLACERFKNGKFEDTAYFEPFYLKEFISTSKL